MARKAGNNLSAESDPDTRICVIYGQEEMLKQQRLDGLRSALQAKHGEIDTQLFDGKTASLSDVLDELRSYGLMQQYKIIIVDDADSYATRHREALERYASQPVDNGVLVLRSVKWNAGKLDKAIAKVGFVEKCEPLKPAMASSWVSRRATEAYQCAIEPRAASLLVERMGTDLLRLDNELAKLTLMVELDGTVQRELVAKVVGQGSEESAWAVQEALLTSLHTGRSGPAIAKLHELVDLSGQPPELVCYFIADILRKLYQASQMLQEGESEASVGKAMRLWGENLTLFLRVLKTTPVSQLAAWLDQIVDLDRRSKIGRGDMLLGLEQFMGMLNRSSQTVHA